MPEPRATTAVVGLGSPLMGDDGVGLEALARLRAHCGDDPTLAWVDGGTGGLALLHAIEGARRVLFLDAIDAGCPPGTVIELEGDALPRRLGPKLSPHEVDLAEVLALAALRGTPPACAAAVGVQPARIALGTTLSPPVAAALDALVERACARLRGWGHGVPGGAGSAVD